MGSKLFTDRRKASSSNVLRDTLEEASFVPKLRSVFARPLLESGLPRCRFTSCRICIGHLISYLRVSITDRCNERCLYCMPQELQEWLPRDEILDDDERSPASCGSRRRSE